MMNGLTLNCRRKAFRRSILYESHFIAVPEEDEGYFRFHFLARNLSVISSFTLSPSNILGENIDPFME